VSRADEVICSVSAGQDRRGRWVVVVRCNGEITTALECASEWEAVSKANDLYHYLLDNDPDFQEVTAH
jgi:hypothetical protein